MIEVNGIKYGLGRLPSTSEKSGLPRFNAALTIPRSDWKPVNRRGVFGKEFKLNQNGYGACVGYSSTAALMKARALIGAAFFRLSGSCTYAQINGGQDRGAVIHDSLKALQSRGTCLETEAPLDSIYLNRIPDAAWETAKRFKIADAYTLHSFDEMASAIMLDYLVVGPVMVGNNFMHVNGEGVAGFDRGPGNHSIHYDGLVKLSNGDWALDNDNTWGTDVGVDGRFLITQRHVESVDIDSYAIRVAAEDPQDPNQPKG